jgi:excisionase family DNA binding protein
MSEWSTGGMSIREFAEQSTLSPSGVRLLIASGRLRATRAGRRVIIPRTELDRLLTEGI